MTFIWLSTSPFASHKVLTIDKPGRERIGIAAVIWYESPTSAIESRLSSIVAAVEPMFMNWELVHRLPIGVPTMRALKP